MKKGRIKLYWVNDPLFFSRGVWSGWTTLLNWKRRRKWVPIEYNCNGSKGFRAFNRNRLYETEGEAKIEYLRLKTSGEEDFTYEDV